MKPLSPALQAHLDLELTTLAYLVKITRADGVVKGFTTHDRDLTVSGVTYKADGAMTPSAIASASALNTDNLDITGMLNDSDITDSDLAAGLYDHARLDMYACNWADLSQGTLQLRRGWIGQIVRSGAHYAAEVRGLHDLLQRPVGAFYTAECRHDLGNAQCGVTLSAYSFTGSVTSATDSATFADLAQGATDGSLNYGVLTWTGGANAGRKADVKKWDAITQTMTLWLPMPNAIAIGDTYSVTRGCDKRFATCATAFANAANFGGFPHMPGVGNILKYPV